MPLQPVETIAIYYTPLQSTQVAAAAGFGLAYHMGLVYTDKTGSSFGATAGPSILSTRQTPALALDALFHLFSNTPSSFGTLVSDTKNNTRFTKGALADYFTQDSDGNEYKHTIVVTGQDLSIQWRKVVETYRAVSQLHLTYAPTSQNSNSMAGTALRRAGISVPFSSLTAFTPGAFTCLPQTSDEAMQIWRRDCVPH